MASINNDTNFTNILKNNTIYVDILTDGTAEMTSNTITNLNYPTNPTDIATKKYVLDQSSINIISPIPYSIQYNDGNNNFASSANLTFNSQLNINDKFQINDILLTNNSINGLSNWYNNQSAINKTYLKSMSSSEYINSSDSTQLTISNIYNNILYRTNNSTSSIIQDILPNSTTITTYITQNILPNTFNFVYKYKGNISTLLFAGYNNTFISQGNFLNYFTYVNCLTVPQNTTIDFKCITSGTNVSFNVLNIQTIYTNNQEQITTTGLRTNKFISELTNTKSAFIIYPLVKTDIVSDSAYEYTFSNIKNILITRNMNNNVTDTFEEILVTEPEFELGTGYSKFTIQNISDYSLTLDIASSTNWAVSPAGNPVIPSGKNGYFYVNYGSTCILYVIGIYNRN